MFDVSSIKSTRTAVLDIKHPKTGEPIGASVTLRSPDHPARQLAAIEFSRAGVKIGEIDNEDRVEERGEQLAGFLAACLDGWDGLSRDGQAIPFAEARTFLAQPGLHWLRTQIHAAINRDELFIEASATN